MTVSVTFTGVTGRGEVDPNEGATAGSVATAAAAELEMTDFDLDQYALVVNGEDADADTPVADGDIVTVAGDVGNG